VPDHDAEDASEAGNEVSQCPYCGSETSCAHLLLVADLTFCEVANGYLYEACGVYLERMRDLDEQAESSHLFRRLIDLVEDFADQWHDTEADAGVCRTYLRRTMYTETPERRMDAMLVLLQL
jgi:hypothetical protein